MKKVLDISVYFVSVLGSLSVLLLTNANVLDVLICFALYIPFSAICVLVNKKFINNKYFKMFATIVSLAVGFFGILISAKLVSETDILTKNLFPLMLVITGVFSTLLSLSKTDAMKSVFAICSFITLSVFILTLILSVIDTDFSSITFEKADFKKITVLMSLVFADAFVMSVRFNNTNVTDMLVGGAIAFLLFILALIVSLSVLSPDVYYNLETPLFKLWQSTYITSFLNRFEVVTVSSLFLMSALKSGAAVSQSVCYFGKKYVSLVCAILVFACLIVSFL